MDIGPPGPKNIPLIDYFINVGISLFGGMVSFLKLWSENPETGLNKKQLWITAIYRVLTAGFAGVLMLWFLKSYAINDYYIAFAVAIAGHMGPEAIDVMRGAINARVSKLSDKDSEPPKGN